jgi:hypothetical protein
MPRSSTVLQAITTLSVFALIGSSNIGCVSQVDAPTQTRSKGMIIKPVSIPPPDDYVHIISDEGLCLGVAGSAPGYRPGPGAAIVQWDCNGFPDKAWSLEPAGSATYVIQNKFTGLCIGIGGYNYDGVHEHQPLVQWDCNGAPDKRWSILGDDIRGFYLRTSIDSNFGVVVAYSEGDPAYLIQDAGLLWTIEQ